MRGLLRRHRSAIVSSGSASHEGTAMAPVARAAFCRQGVAVTGLLHATGAIRVPRENARCRPRHALPAGRLRRSSWRGSARWPAYCRSIWMMAQPRAVCKPVRGGWTARTSQVQGSKQRRVRLWPPVSCGLGEPSTPLGSSAQTRQGLLLEARGGWKSFSWGSKLRAQYQRALGATFQARRTRGFSPVLESGDPARGPPLEALT